MLDEDEISRVCREIESRFEALSISEAEAEQPPSVLYHYTSAEGILGIIKSSQLWATNVLYLNDASELSGARDLFGSELQSAPLKLGSFARSNSITIPYHAKDVPIDHFVTSFCEDGDLLSQWRAYGSQGTGYSIGFRSSTLLAAAKSEANNLLGACTLRKVKYRESQKGDDPKKNHRSPRDSGASSCRIGPTGQKEHHQLVRIWLQIAASLHSFLSLMKHETFDGEQEWRLVRTLWTKVVPTADWPVELRTISGRLVPYLPMSWAQLDSPSSEDVRGIKEVRCGPSVNPELKEKAVRDLLIWKHLRVDVSLSKIPLRA